MKLLRALMCIFFAICAGVFVYFRLTVKKDVSVPVITCESSELYISVNTSESELLQYVTAFDSNEGDLTRRVFIENVSPYISGGRADITYVVCDSNNNVGRLVVPAFYTDYHSPHFLIKKPLIIPLRARDFDINDYIEVDDCIDGKSLSDEIITVSDFDITVPGVYPITLKTTNSRFDSSTIELTIQVATTQVVDTVALSQYILYCSVGDEIDYSSFIAEPDAEAVAVDSSDVEITKPGIYEVIYRAAEKLATKLIIVCEEVAE